MKELNDKIIEWLKKHNIDKLSPDKQYLKIVEEVGELARGLLKNDLEAIKDAIGDIYIALTGLSLQLDIEDSGRFVYKYWDNCKIIKEIMFILCREFDEVCYVAFTGLLYTLATNNNLTLEECVDHAYNQVKDRDIKIIEGVAVK